MKENINILIYSKDDLKKDRTFKKRNNIKNMNIKEFKEYLNNNNLNIHSEYIDSVGFIFNNLRFRCYYNNMIIGVNNIIKKVKE